MRNTYLFLEDRFMAISPIGKRQSAIDQLFDNDDLSFRLKADVKMNLVDERRTILDCSGVDVDDEILQRSRMLVTLTFPQGVTPQIMAIFGGYYLGAYSGPTGAQANEVQTLTRSGTVSGGVFVATLDFESRIGVSVAIPYNATAADILALLTKATPSLSKLIQPGDITVTGDWTGGIVITFAERLKRANLPLMTINNTAITGGGSVVNTATANGNQYLHQFTRSSSRTKTKFNFAVGDESGSVATDKYFNAVVDSFAPTLGLGDDVGLTVGIICNSTPNQEEEFDVPECINYPALETKDCAIKVGTLYQHLDIFNQAITLNDQVPTGKEMYGFDGKQLENILRGKNPQYAMPTQIIASRNDAIAALVNTKQPVETHFGLPGNRFSIIAGNALLKPQAELYPYVGELGRSAIALDISPHRDGANVPVKFEARVDQAEAFLQAAV